MLRFEEVEIISDELFDENPIPDFKAADDLPFFRCSEEVDREIADRVGKGLISSSLPYKMMNLYGGKKKTKKFRAAVLENELVKAVFLPELGGRMWSLYHKGRRRDLIYKNREVIFANLAICNAWFAGGVEFNEGMKGHSPLTARRLFARGAKGKLGNDILRMYEYDAIRDNLYSIEATLDGEKLFISVEIRNAKDTPSYTYWWSNIAMPEKGARVFVPADSAFVTSYRDGGYCISKMPLTKEMSPTEHAKTAIDYFYDIKNGDKKWIACVYDDGVGLLHTSDDILKGRKTFLWGKGRGGRHWNERLTGAGDYFEIQAGLCKTQFEHLPLKGGEVISFTECYTLADVGKETDHDGCVEILKKQAEAVEDEKELFEKTSMLPLYTLGSGIGRLCEMLTGRKLYEGYDFPDESIGESLKYYKQLILGKECEGDDKTDFVIDHGIKRLLLAKENKNFFDHYALSVIEYANGECDGAIESLERSLELKRTYYTLSAAALLYYKLKGEPEKAYVLSKEAVGLAPKNLQAALIFAEISLAAGKRKELLEYCEHLSASIKNEGRIRLYIGKCLIELGRLEEAKKYINKDLSIPDVREGEYSTSTLWCELYRKIIARERGIEEGKISAEEVLCEYPLPYEIDFRMH